MAHVWWYSARSAGLVAWVLLTMSTIWGLALSTKLRPPRVRPAWTLDLHRFLGGLAVVFVGVHVGAVMLDSYVPFGAADVLVPFASGWKPLAVAWGIVGMYLLLAVELTSLARKRLSHGSGAAPLLVVPALPQRDVAPAHRGTDAHTRAGARTVAVTCTAIAGLTAWRIHTSTRTPARSDARVAAARQRDLGPHGVGRRRHERWTTLVRQVEMGSCSTTARFLARASGHRHRIPRVAPCVRGDRPHRRASVLRRRSGRRRPGAPRASAVARVPPQLLRRVRP